METVDTTSSRKKYLRVLILPMRNGNATSRQQLARQFEVLILPMRNGNYVLNSGASLSNSSVLILPTRNGNSFDIFIVSLVSLFLSYLRGMETVLRSKKRKEDWEFLSYLRGMETISIKLVSVRIFSSYPTYEEWKQLNSFIFCVFK